MAKQSNKSNKGKGGGLHGVVQVQYQHVTESMELDPTTQKAFGLVPAATEALRKIKATHATPYVTLKYYDHGYECFSEWEAENLKAFSALNGKLGSMSWPDIYKSAGSAGNKTGVGYTPLDLSTVSEKSKQRLKLVHDKISPDLTFFELRVTQEARVHGFRAADAFFLVLLDQAHDVYKGK